MMSTIHRPHPIHGEWPSGSDDHYRDPDDAILYDRCDRCGEHAVNLRGLDDTKLAALHRRMLDVEFGDRDSYATKIEGRAAAELRHALETTARLFDVDVYARRRPVTGAQE